MYRVFLGLIFCILLVLTLVLGFINPKMHKSIIVYDHEYAVTEPEKKEKAATVKYEMLSQVKKEKKVQKIEPVKTVKTQQKKVEKKDIVKAVSKVKIPSAKTVETQTVSVQIQQENKEILWNKWRSDIQNRIMQDVKMPIIKEGTVFKFSFDVDKYGKITNVKTWSTDAGYTPYAIQCIAPVIKSYQGRDILNFPEGSDRFETTVEGGWKISKMPKYSTPQDFNDKETVRTK